MQLSDKIDELVLATSLGREDAKKIIEISESLGYGWNQLINEVRDNPDLVSYILECVELIERSAHQE